MQELTFEKKVSKGSKFNQIYVPKELESEIQAGDLVEVKLICKASNLYFHNVKELSEFKRKLITELIKTIQNYSQENKVLVKQIFFIGSFLTEKVDYNDIDIIIVTNSKQKTESVQTTLEQDLIENFNLKFHILAINEETLNKLLQICPLTISMFSRFVSNKEFIDNSGRYMTNSPELSNRTIPKKSHTNHGIVHKADYPRKIDKAHIQSLLMMPQDLLEIDLNSKVFFDNLRRLIAIEKFLENQELDAEKINQELKKLLGERVFKIIKNNEIIDDELRKVLRKHIENKLNNIQKELKSE